MSKFFKFCFGKRKIKILYLLEIPKYFKMKKIILSATAIFAFAFNSSAQDLMFETWSAAAPPFATILDPSGWATLNALNLVGTDTSVFKETVAPGQGLISAKIKTVKVVGAAIPSPYTTGNIDTAGILVMGKINAFPTPGLTYGKPLSGRPATLSFVSKYTPMAGDSAFVLAYLTKWNGASRDTIAYGKYATGIATTTFAANSLTMNYDLAFSSVWADTMLVFASSSVYSHPGAKIGSTFYIDAMSWSGYNGINENANFGSVSVSPNPAINYISFTSSVNANAVEILDITGRKVGIFLMVGNAVTVQTSSFNAGIYIYNVLNEKKEVINRGKFEVTK
jgi:Secretion system C-terminal sorting domain